jgi:hypothetical protein
MDTRSKIKRVSRILRYLTLIYLCAGPISKAIFWITNGEPLHPFFKISIWPEALIAENCLRPIATLAPMTKILGFLVSLIPNIFSVLALYYLARLFKLFEGLEFFSQNSVSLLRKIGFALLGGQLIYPIYTALISLTVTISNPPGERMIATAFGTAELSWTALALVIILASWIMDEGRKLQEEQEATI